MRKLIAIACLLPAMCWGLIFDDVTWTVHDSNNVYADNVERVVAAAGEVYWQIVSGEAATIVLEYLFGTGADPTPDTSTYGNDGDVYSAAWTTNAVGSHQWYYHDGVDDYIVSTVTQDKVTIELWATANSGNHWSHYVRAGTAEYVDGVAQAWTESDYYTITGNVITQSLTTAGNVDTFRVHSVSNDAATVYTGYTNDLINVMGLSTQADQTNGAVLSMHFDYPETAGIGHDSSTNLNHGTYNGSEGQQLHNSNGVWVGSCGFDGVDDKLNPTENGIESAQQGTISAWIYPHIATATTRPIVSESAALRFLLYLYDGQLRVYMNASGAKFGRATSSIPANQWTHVALTSNGSTWTFFVNGVNEGYTALGGSNSGEWFGDVSGTLSIGSEEYAPAKTYFDGEIGYVRIDASVLTDTYISNTLYAAEAPKYGITP